MKNGLLSIALMALAACAAVPAIRWVPASDYALAVTDNPGAQRFDVTLISRAKAPICVSREWWPTVGALPAGFDGATLVLSGGARNLLPTGSAYCPGGCGEIRIEPGRQLQGQIPYSAFGDAAEIAADGERSLGFQVHPYECAVR
ncbi:hypothetical protein [uncultured Stenotrophomonas sp.]|uniref:hypothetical protein n=1 Tax=uncultured Stenotrophomonas sp. TaxID=165438 RepID=UPI0025FCC9BE|nr:hypothetical protein [uncultured Stenotrophomonas sp.]